MEMVTGEAMTPSPIYLTNMQPLEIIDKNDAQSPEQFMAFPNLSGMIPFLNDSTFFRLSLTVGYVGFLAVCRPCQPDETN